MAASGGDNEPAARTEPPRPDGLGPVEILAIVSLLAAELLFILVGLAAVMWMAGIVLLVVARRWSGRQKWLGALGLALGFPIAMVLFLFPVPSGTTSCTLGAAGVQDCVTEGGWPDWGHTAAQVGLVAYLCFQVWTIWRLTRRR